jgi:hypothetical protein
MALRTTAVAHCRSLPLRSRVDFAPRFGSGFSSNKTEKGAQLRSLAIHFHHF